MEEHVHKPPEGCRKANARFSFINSSIMIFSTLSSYHNYIIYQAIYNIESALTSSTLISHCHGVHWSPMHGIYSIYISNCTNTHVPICVYIN